MQTIYSDQQVLPTIKDLTNAPATGKELLSAARIESAGGSIQVNSLDLKIKDDYHFSAVGPASFCIAIFLDGYGSLAIENGEPLSIQPGTTVLFHTPRRCRGNNHFRAGSHLRCLDLRFTPDAIRNFGLESLNLLLPLFQRNCSVHDVMMLARPTTAKLAAIAQDVMSCDLEGLAREIFLQAKALEALAHCIAVLQPETAGALRFSQADKSRIQHAIQLLTEAYQHPWTIASLAKEVGLNERKLKAGFRQFAQSTVHRYQEDMRLQAARAMLSEGRTVTEVSLAVGYANPSHFAKRFRARFDVTPKRWSDQQR